MCSLDFLKLRDHFPGPKQLSKCQHSGGYAATFASCPKTSIPIIPFQILCNGLANCGLECSPVVLKLRDHFPGQLLQCQRLRSTRGAHGQYRCSCLRICEQRSGLLRNHAYAGRAISWLASDRRVLLLLQGQYSKQQLSPQKLCTPPACHILTLPRTFPPHIPILTMALPGLNTRSISSTLQWNQRMRNRRIVRPCVTSTTLLSVKRPISMSRVKWSSKIVMRSYTSAPLSPLGNLCGGVDEWD